MLRTADGTLLWTETLAASQRLLVVSVFAGIDHLRRRRFYWTLDSSWHIAVPASHS
ncbi:MAG: hypothetical protein ACLQUY_08635 [Ktedonobacterales bacterium]